MPLAAMASEELHLNDAVSVEQSSSPPLEGVVAHLGPVQFAPGSEWIGVRLTGPSAGRGKNDGTVKGVRYFQPGGDKNGMFVKRANVRKRKLSKLEELRLRRELTSGAGSGGGGGGGRASGAPGGSAAAGKPSSSLRSPASRGAAGKSPAGAKPGSAAGAPSSRKVAPSSAGGGETGTSKLEALRARREALAKERGSRGTATTTTKSDETEEGREGGKEKGESEGKDDDSHAAEGGATPAKVNIAAATPGYRAELHRLQSKISDLQTALQKKETECASLQSSLDFMSKGAEQSTHDAVRMYAMGALALTEAKSPSRRNVGRASLGGGGGGGALAGKVEESEEEDEDESGSDDDVEESGEEEGGEGIGEEGVVNQAAAAVSQALVQRNDELTSQLTAKQQELAELQHQLSEAEERASNVSARHEQSTENYQREKEARKEERAEFDADRAVLNSQVASLQRELGVLQERVSSKSSLQEHSHASAAKLRAELVSAQRRCEVLDEEKLELETTMEELVLDKEQLREEREMLEDKLEECRIDVRPFFCRSNLLKYHSVVAAR